MLQIPCWATYKGTELIPGCMCVIIINTIYLNKGVGVMIWQSDQSKCSPDNLSNLGNLPKIIKTTRQLAERLIWGVKDRHENALIFATVYTYSPVVIPGFWPSFDHNYLWVNCLVAMFKCPVRVLPANSHVATLKCQVQVMSANATRLCTNAKSDNNVKNWRTVGDGPHTSKLPRGCV